MEQLREGNSSTRRKPWRQGMYHTGRPKYDERKDYKTSRFDMENCSGLCHWKQENKNQKKEEPLMELVQSINWLIRLAYPNVPVWTSTMPWSRTIS